MIRWKVRPGDGDTVDAVLERASLAGDPAVYAGAIAEGRVFVGRKRIVRGAEGVSVGDEMTVAAPLGGRGEEGGLVLLANDDDIVAAVKPAGIPTIPDHHGADHALIAVVARAVGVAAGDLHATSRLDRDVSGVVVFAKTKRAAELLHVARADNTYGRRYVAIAMSAIAASRKAGGPPFEAPLDAVSKTETGVWDAPIGRAKDPRHRAAHGKDPAAARTLWRVVGHGAPSAGLGVARVLALAPITGRTHQLRVHAAHAGTPLLGDRVYGGPSQVTLSNGRVVAITRIALHCARVSLPGRAPLCAEIPRELVALWQTLGGSAEAWDTATSCPLGPFPSDATVRGSSDVGAPR